MWPNWWPQAAASIGGVTTDEPALLDEVTDLIEAPQALLGTFEENYLDLPAPVLIGVMKKHQRYFPVLKDGALINHFMTVANGNELAHPEVVREGNEGVIRARYADAAYFYRHDTARPLESYTPRLATLTFHAKLGSMLDRVERLKQLAPAVAGMLGATPAQIATVTRAAALSQVRPGDQHGGRDDQPAGHHRRNLRRQGRRDAGRWARPSASSTCRAMPATMCPPRCPALRSRLADKLDSLAGLFAVKAIPTGSADPFGLRRAALGIVNSLLATKTDFSVGGGLAAAAGLQPVPVSAEALAETATFVARRLEGVLADAGYAHDVVDAVLAVRGDNPAAAVRACDALTAAVAQPAWTDVFTAYARCVRITRSLDERLPLNPAAYVEPVEQALHAAYLAAVACHRACA